MYEWEPPGVEVGSGLTHDHYDIRVQVLETQNYSHHTSKWFNIQQPHRWHATLYHICFAPGVTRFKVHLIDIRGHVAISIDIYVENNLSSMCCTICLQHILKPRPCTPIFITRTCRGGGGRCGPRAFRNYVALQIWPF